MITIYVLKCSNKYYVGKTLADVDKRFNTHKKVKELFGQENIVL